MAYIYCLLPFDVCCCLVILLLSPNITLSMFHVSVYCLLLACAPSHHKFMYSFRFRVICVMVDVQSPHFIIVIMFARHLGIIIVIESFHL